MEANVDSVIKLSIDYIRCSTRQRNQLWKAIKLSTDCMRCSTRSMETNVDYVIKLIKDYITCSIKPTESNVDSLS